MQRLFKTLMKYYYRARKIVKYIGTILKNSNEFIKLYKIQIFS